MRCLLPLACLVFGLISCSQKDDARAPRIEDCEGANCDPNMGNGGGHLPPVSTTPDSMAPPPDSMEDAGSSTAGTLVGDVTMLTGTDLSMGVAVENDVELSALGSAGGRVTTRYDGDADFSLEGVQITGNLWVGVRAVGTPVRPLMPTLQAVNSTETGRVHLVVVERASLEDIAGQSALLTPVALDSSLGHLVVYFVDQDDQPVQGVSILDTTAVDGALIAYDAGNTYSDSFEATDVHGSALLLNLDSNSFPGDAKTIAFNYGGLDSSFVVDVAQDTITIALVVLN